VGFRNYRIKISEKDVTAYVVKSLQQEMFSWPKGEDMTQQNKSNAIIGSTINLGLGYTRFYEIHPGGIQTMVPNLNVVAYLRSNKVKHAISIIRGRVFQRMCHAKVVTDKCKLDRKTVVTHSEFHKTLRFATKYDRIILNTAKEFTQILRKQSRVIWYEDLLGFDDEIEKLLDWLGFDINDLEMRDKFIGRCSLNCTKTNSDDLRDVIANYEEFESLINSKYYCLSTQFYETRPGKVQSFVDSLCGDDFMRLAHS